jgi:uncharacterized membrane protein YqjE
MDAAERTVSDHGPDTSHAPIAELVARATEQTSRLVREELRLAQVEMTEKGKAFALGAGLFGGAGVLAGLGAATLVAAAVAALALVVPVWASALIVAAALFLVAAGIGVAGRRETARAVPVAPEQAVTGLRTDVATIKESAKR